MRIVDQWGNPIQSNALDEPQTAGRAALTHLHREVAGHPSRGITPAKLNQILEAAEMGDLTAQHELFTDMEERDSHVFSELSKRKRASIKLSWDVVPPRNPSKQEQALADYAKEQLLDMYDLEDLLFDALDGISHGFAALELEWQRVGADWTIAKATHRPQTWFQMDRDTRTKINLRDNSVDGQPLQPFGWLLHVHKAISGYTSRSGLGRVLVWPYLFKHFSVGDLAEFLDIHGLPMILGKFPGHATDAEKATLWRAVAGIGHNARGIIPESMAVEITEASKAGADPFVAMMDWCEQSQSKAINGSTLTSKSGATGLGSGLAEIHNEVRLDIRDSDCKQLAGTITRDLIYPLLAVNKGWADARRTPRFVFDTQEAEDLKIYADALPKLVSIGMRIPPEWAHDKLRIPQAAEKDPVLSTTPPQAPASKPKAALAALKRVATAQGLYPDQDAVDGALEQLDADLQGQAAKWLEPAIVAVTQADSAEAALALLAGDNPMAADDVLIEAIARAMFVVELLGADAARKEMQNG